MYQFAFSLLYFSLKAIVNGSIHNFGLIIALWEPQSQVKVLNIKILIKRHEEG